MDAVIARGAKAEAALRAAGYEVLWLPTNGGSRTEIVEVTGRRPAAGHWR
jgi:uroporphyrinogen-III synthase